MDRALVAKLTRSIRLCQYKELLRALAGAPPIARQPVRVLGEIR
jgi:hypothetical protein